jgi:ferredoxin-like protein FixX
MNATTKSIEVKAGNKTFRGTIDTEGSVECKGIPIACIEHIENQASWDYPRGADFEHNGKPWSWRIVD